MSWKEDRLKRYVVYGIHNPETDQYVYIGSTKQRLVDRKSGHCCRHCNCLDEFIDDQRSKGKKINYVIIHDCEVKDESNNDLEYWEYFYIKKFKAEGHPLCNRTIRNILYPGSNRIIELLKTGKFNNAWISKKLYSDLPEKSAISKFRNKLQNVNGRSFTPEELKEIENILK